MNQSDREKHKSSFEKDGSGLPPKLFPCNPGPATNSQQQASNDGGRKRGVIVAPTPEAGRE